MSPTIDSYGLLVALLAVAFLFSACEDPSATRTSAADKSEVEKQIQPAAWSVGSENASANDKSPPRKELPTASARSAGSTIEAGETISGRLATDDPVLGDGSHYDEYVYEGSAGEQLVITLSSDEFDTYLMLGREIEGEQEIVARNDDTGESTNSRIDAVLSASGTYRVLVNSYAEGEQGAYELNVRSAREASQLQSGQTASGELSADDPMLSADGTHYDLWLYEGSKGEEVTVTMRSEDLDAYLIAGFGSLSDFSTLSEDDDSGGDLDAEIVITLPEDGMYTILANSYEAETGSYTLSVESEAPKSFAEIYPGGGNPSERYALLVGIDDYPGTDSDLNSPVADARIMRDVLIDEYGYDPDNVVMLIDEEANREHIINAFVRHLGQVGPQGTALFYYSGHGMQMEENMGLGLPIDAEEDGVDEALYVWGYNQQSSVLLDDEIGYLADQLDTEQIVVLLDACNSGTGSRGTGLPKQVTQDMVADHLYVPRAFATKGLEGAAEAEAPPSSVTDVLDLMGQRQPHVLLAAAQDDQYAYTASGWPDRGGVASVFTYYLADALESADDQTTFEELLQDVQERVEAYSEAEYGATQTPQVGGRLASTPVMSFFRGQIN